MNTAANEAIENINIIKNTMDESRISYTGLYKLCIVFGTCNIVLTLASYLSVLLVFNTFITTGFLTFTTILIRILSFAVPLIAYVLICKKEKSYNNRFYLSIIDTWAVISILLPVFRMIINLIQYNMISNGLLPQTDPAQMVLINSADLSAAVLFLMIIIIYSNISRKPYIKIIGLIILFIQMFLSMIELSFLPGTADHSTLISFPGYEVYMTFSSIFAFLVFGIGYIIIGVLIKKKVEASTGKES